VRIVGRTPTPLRSALPSGANVFDFSHFFFFQTYHQRELLPTSSTHFLPSEPFDVCTVLSRDTVRVLCSVTGDTAWFLVGRDRERLRGRYERLVRPSSKFCSCARDVCSSTVQGRLKGHGALPCNNLPQTKNKTFHSRATILLTLWMY
jgi:hypothetical protein